MRLQGRASSFRSRSSETDEAHSSNASTPDSSGAPDPPPLCGVQEPAPLPKAALAAGAVALGAAVFLLTRGGPGAITFETLQTESVPLQMALSSQRPTVIEFYASW